MKPKLGKLIVQEDLFLCPSSLDDQGLTIESSRPSGPKIDSKLSFEICEISLELTQVSLEPSQRI